MLDSIKEMEPTSNSSSAFQTFTQNNKDLFSQAKLQVLSREKDSERRNRDKPNNHQVMQKRKKNSYSSHNNIIEEVNELNEELSRSLVSSNDNSFLIDENKSSVENWISISQTLMELSTPRKVHLGSNAGKPTNFTRNQWKSKTHQEKHNLTLSSIKSKHNRAFLNQIAQTHSLLFE